MKTLKELIYMTLEVHAQPLTPREITDYIVRIYGYETNDHTVSARLSEMRKDGKYAIADFEKRSLNGGKFKYFFIPSIKQEIQLEIFK